MSQIEETKNRMENSFGIDIEQMKKAGLQFGHRISASHPKMKPYIAGSKNTIYLISLEKSMSGLEKALEFIQDIISQNKVLLLVGTKIQIKGLVREVAEECGLPYVNERWLGGTITNFAVIKKRIEYFNELERKKEEGELEKYTKKEKLIMDRQLKDFEIKFGGIKNLKNIPDAIFVLDVRKDNIAIKEARRKNIPIIGIVDTNVNPELVDYVIPANDDAISSVKYILEKVKETIQKSKIKNQKSK